MTLTPTDIISAVAQGGSLKAAAAALGLTSNAAVKICRKTAATWQRYQAVLMAAHQMPVQPNHPAVHCPHCHVKAKVINEPQFTAKRTQFRRRRECPECRYRFTTYETQGNPLAPVVLALAIENARLIKEKSSINVEC